LIAWCLAYAYPGGKKQAALRNRTQSTNNKIQQNIAKIIE